MAGPFSVHIDKPIRLLFKYLPGSVQNFAIYFCNTCRKHWVLIVKTGRVNLLLESISQLPLVFGVVQRLAVLTKSV